MFFLRTNEKILNVLVMYDLRFREISTTADCNSFKKLKTLKWDNSAITKKKKKKINS
jgi:hypothetical protein